VRSGFAKVERVPLGSVAEINPPIPNEAVSDPDLEVSFVPMAGVSDITASVRTSEVRSVGACLKGYTSFRRHDILVAKITPCFENGKIAEADIPCEFGFGSTEFHVVRPSRDVLDGRFLLHVLRGPKFRAQGERRMTGSAGQRRVPVDFLSTFDIPFPPLLEQRRIAEILDKADALRAKRRAALAQLDILTQSIFLAMFGDPATNPKGWSEGDCLGDVADIVSGITKGRKLNGQATRTVPYLAVVNVQDRALDLSRVKSIDATESEIARYRLMANDLLLTEGGDPDKLGRGTLWSSELPECIHQNHIFRVRLTTDRLHPLFLNWLVGSRRGRNYFLRSAKQTTGIASINMTQLRGFPLLVPPIEHQRSFAERAADVSRLKRQLSATERATDALFASLQHRAFRGEL
jgi:type I restriction enzyme S subunit